MIKCQTSWGRKSRMLFTLLLFMSFSSCFGQEQGYAVFDSTTGTLTFQYGTPTGTAGTDYYNTDNTGTNVPGWWYDNRESIKKVVFDSSFADARPTSCVSWFDSCTNLTEIDGIEYLNTSNVTNMGSMFSGCSGLTSLDVSHFNTANVTRMNSMFSGCRGLTSLDVTHFNTANVTGMGGMFRYCSGLTSLDVTHFNTAKVTDMSEMFSRCSGLTNLNLNNFNTANVTDMNWMFGVCSGLTSLDLSNFNTANVTNMVSMFRNCSNLTSLTFGENFTAANVTDMRYMFYYCSSLTSLDLSNFNTAKVTSMGDMFSGCSSLTNLDVSNFNTANVTDMSSMFTICRSLTSLNLSSFNTSSVTSMSSMFFDCSGLTSLNLSNFNTEKVTNMTQMFCGCSGLTSLDLSNFNTANVTDMNSMFWDCSSLTSLDVSNFNTANVTNMEAMFSLCSGLTSLNLSNFNTAKVTDMLRMFDGCSGLTSLNLSNFNTANVTNMGYIFWDCSSMTCLTFGKDFTTAHCTNLRGVFYRCSKLRYLDFYDSNDDNSHGFSNTNIDRSSNSAFLGAKYNGLPLTTVVYMPHNIRRSDYTDGENFNLPNLVFDDGNGELTANIYYSVDKVDIEFPRDFRTNKAEYSRSMNAATQYGTVILPYEFTTNESVQAYLLRAEHTGTMWYEEVESVPAHTPFFYSKKTASDTNVNFNKTVANYGITIEATHTTSNAEGGEPYGAASGMDGWTTKGYYITETVDASSGNTYYISGDKFWRATGTLKMNPHRVTYQGQWQYDPDATEAPAMLNIITMGASETGDDLPSEVSTAIEAAHLRSLQQNARDIYDAQGRRQSELKSGLNIVRMADGTTVKIVKR